MKVNIRSRRLQFSLGTLLALVTLAAMAWSWYAYRRASLQRVAKAAYALRGVEEDFTHGKVAHEGVIVASKNLLRAQLAVPFADRRDALLVHRNRMVDTKKRFYCYDECYMRCRTDEDKRRVDLQLQQLGAMVTEAETWLAAGQITP